MASTLVILWEGKKIGTLWLSEKQKFSFRYDSSWLSSEKSLPISMRLPLREEVYDDDACRAFFSNLLPEAKVRERVAEKFGVSHKNDFKLLEKIGGECAGALRILPTGTTDISSGEYQPISDAELDRMIAEIPETPLLTSQEGLRLSLAGAQEKLPVYLKEDAVFLPHGSNPSTHILKPAIPRFANTVENEGFCMKLAAKSALPVPPVQIRKGKKSALLVERYDRSRVTDPPTRLHQEDMCQALGYSYEQKYQADGGPGLQECFNIIDENCSQPIIDKRNVLRWCVFNFIIGNCDAHAKNISVLISPDGIRLAPFYDILSTSIYPGLDAKLAMKIGGENRLEWVMKRHWERLADVAGVKPKAIFAICEELIESVPSSSEELAHEFSREYGGEETIAKIQARTQEAIEHLTRNLKPSASTTPSPKESEERFTPEIKTARDRLYAIVGSNLTHLGGWEAILHPLDHQSFRLPDLRKARDLTKNATISLRGWPFPYIDPKQSGFFLKGYYSNTNWKRHVEGFVTNQSGLFLWQKLMWEDLETSPGSRSQKTLSFLGMIFELTEILLFAGTYSPRVSRDERFRLRVTLQGTANRVLTADPSINLDNSYICREPEIPLEGIFSSTELKERGTEIANDWIRKALLIFGAESISSTVIKEWQDKLISKKL